MKVDVHVGMALLLMREVCKQQGDCVKCPLLSFCRSTNGFVPCMTDPDTFPNLIVKVEIPVDKL